MTTQAISLTPVARQRYLLVLLFAGFVLTGLEITLVGPLLPVFEARWSLNDSQAGIFSIVQFAASFGGMWLSSLVAHWLGNRASLVLGYLTVGAGLAAANSQTMGIALVALSALGLGYGLVVPVTNLAVAEIGGTRRASLVSLVNFAWGAGAFSCSPIVLLALKAKAVTGFLYLASSCGCLLAICFLLCSFPEERSDVASSTSTVKSVNNRKFVVVVLAALFFLYVGTEVSLGYWAALHTQRIPGGAAGLATLAPMFFYGGLMTVRALAPFILSRVKEFQTIMASVGIVICGVSVFIIAPTRIIAFVGAAVAGSGCATIFPILIAWLSRWFGTKAGLISSIMFSMSSIASFCVPPVVGTISAYAGGLRVGLTVQLFSAVAIGFLLLLVRRQATA